MKIYNKDMKSHKQKSSKPKKAKLIPAPLVDKAAFDDLLGKLLRTAPLPQSEVITDKQKPKAIIDRMH